MPDLPANLNADAIKPNQANQWLWLAEFVVPSATTQRIARNTEGITYDGVTYEANNFNVGGQMFSADGSIPTAQIQVADLNKTFEKLINDTEGALGGTVQLVKVNSDFLSTAIPALEADYQILAAGSDDTTVTFTLGIPNPLIQRFPLFEYSATVCPLATPSLFGGCECQYAGADPTCTGFYDDCYTKGNAAHWAGEHGLDKNTMSL